MAVNRRTRTSQYPLVAEYVFNYNDGAPYLSSLAAASVDGNMKSNVKDFGSGVAPLGMLSGVTFDAQNVAAGGTSYFELLALPVGAQVIGGDVHVETAYVGPATATISLGDENDAAIYASAVSIKTAARTALTLPLETPLVNAYIGQDIRMTLVLGIGAATAGRVRVRVMYTIDNRANENCAQ